ncbi:beta-N-acetylhexosaminidase [Selenomonas ruminantium]|uniref:beta-N-acetylhexosaminidase n=1 Tax=Selenomonas ruminantium TaxID=971 RepID=A0A1I3EJD0_SELRU|nr:glycoside hydrolase family 3 N-terminal domain-containing protein [Selenomonas ruminantium]SFH98960.1 beta-N-acetylhexosaminidase [Selenomonas ruminantium]
MWNKKFAALIGGIVVLAVVGGISFSSGWDKSNQKAGNIVSEKTLDEKVDAIVDKMTYKEKLGQMVMIGIHGTELSDDAAYMLSQYHIGNVILFDRNLQSREQTAKLTADLQRSAKENAHQPVPLFIAIDEEGGRVVRGRNFIEPPPSQQELGNAGETTAVEAWARKTGAALKDLGINVNFAPVADIGSQDTRSYSNDPDAVVKFVKAAAQGYESSREIYALKHFPGIGRGTVDSHKDISSIDVTEDTLFKSDLKPFQALIDEKADQDFFILVSHLKYPQLDKENAASQSHAIVTGLLRKKMGYNGLIITDDLEMGAVAKYGSYRDIGVKAVKAGVDIVMMCHEYPHETDVYLGLLAAYENGELDKDQIDASVRRIVKAKLRNGIPY